MEISLTVLSWIGFIVFGLAWIISWLVIIIMFDDCDADKGFYLLATIPIPAIGAVSFSYLNSMYTWFG